MYSWKWTPTLEPTGWKPKTDHKSAGLIGKENEMNNRIPGLNNEAVTEKEEAGSRTAKIIKWSVLALVILLASSMVAVSVLYTRFVSVEDGQWIIDLSEVENVDRREIERIEQRFPDAVVLSKVDLGGMKVDNTIDRLTITDSQGVAAERLVEAAEELPCLKLLNLTGLSVSTEQYEQLREAYPDAQIQWVVPVLKPEGLSTDTARLELSSMSELHEIMAVLHYLPKLSYISIVGVPLNDAEHIEVKQLSEQLSARNILLEWGITVAGQSYDRNTSDIRFAGNYDAGDLAELCRLPCLASLTLDGIQTGDLSPLTSITTLESITICNMNVDDIMVLAQMDWLGAVYVKNTNVGWTQLNRLQDELPECIMMVLE